MTPERSRSRRTTPVAIGSAAVLVLAGVALALALSGSDGGASARATVGAGVLPTAPASAPVRSATRPAVAARRPSGAWPVGLTAWTVVVASLPHTGHPRAAVERSARAASRPGLPVRVLDSSQHPRLRPALWIVFAGRYATRAQAERRALSLRQAGTRHAVVERLTG